MRKVHGAVHGHNRCSKDDQLGKVGLAISSSTLDDSLLTIFQDKIMDHKTLHSLGVLHADPKTTHWLQHHPLGPIRILDFEHSKCLGEMPLEEWEDSCKGEWGSLLEALKL